MRHVTRHNAAEQTMARRRDVADRAADRTAADVAGMNEDELIELIGGYPLSDAPDAGEYFESAVRELAARIDKRQAVTAGA